jgi:hypothetical protein
VGQQLARRGLRISNAPPEVAATRSPAISMVV